MKRSRPPTETGGGGGTGGSAKHPRSSTFTPAAAAAAAGSSDTVELTMAGDALATWAACAAWIRRQGGVVDPCLGLAGGTAGDGEAKAEGEGEGEEGATELRGLVVRGGGEPLRAGRLLLRLPRACLATARTARADPALRCVEAQLALVRSPHPPPLPAASQPLGSMTDGPPRLLRLSIPTLYSRPCTLKV
jgi:hypothetical protein